jgi:hypothetical protein
VSRLYSARADLHSAFQFTADSVQRRERQQQEVLERFIRIARHAAGSIADIASPVPHPTLNFAVDRHPAVHAHAAAAVAFGANNVSLLLQHR